MGDAIFRSPNIWRSAFCPVLLVVTQFISQKMTPQPRHGPGQQKMMMFMPLVFGFMFYIVLRGWCYTG